MFAESYDFQIIGKRNAMQRRKWLDLFLGRLLV